MMKKQSHENKSPIAHALAFLRRGQWQMRAEKLPWHRRIALKTLRFFSLVFDGFKRNQCPLHAASLTFYSLMALVPVLVLALALARAFGGDEYARKQIDFHVNSWLEQFEKGERNKFEVRGNQDDTPEQSVQSPITSNLSPTTSTDAVQSFATQVKEITQKLYKQIDEIKFGTLGGIGLVLLLWAAVGVLGKVEKSFNEIWGVEKSRPWIRKFFDYLGVILILPFLITVVSSIPIAAKAIEIAEAMDKTVGWTAAETFSHLLHSTFFKTGTTLVTGTLTFAFLLGFMPNARVKAGPALIGGFVTIVLFAAWLKICTMLQVGIARNSALYGGFAVLPILLMWVQISWQIVLLGAEIAFAAQNRDTYVLEQYATDANVRARLMLALGLCAEAARQAKIPGGGPFAAEAFAHEKGIPNRFVREVLECLVQNNIFAEVAGETGNYLLYRCGDSMTVADIIHVFLNSGELPSTLGLDSLGATIEQFDKTLGDVISKHLAIPMIT